MTTTDSVQLNISGDVSGQIAIGDNIMQIQNNGGIVYVVQQKQTKFEKIKGAIRQRPRAYPDLLDRTLETSVVRSSLRSKLSVSVFGGNGIGKTTFLTHMAYLSETEEFSDGVAYFYAKNVGLDDLLQIIFDAFYTSSDAVIPTTGQLRHRLQRVEAVILLDELTLDREDAQALRNILPASLFLFGSTEQNLWGEGQIISLGGLPEQECLDLFAREIGRDLSDREKADVQVICEKLGHHPLKIIRAASLVRSKSKTIVEIRSQFEEEAAAMVVDKELFNSMDDKQKKVLAALGAGDGALTPLGIITSLVKLPDVQLQSILDGLVSSGFVWVQDGRFAVNGEIVAATGKIWDLTPWRNALVEFFTEWVAQKPEDRLIEDASNILLRVVQYAGEKNRWPEVIRIGRAVERILILHKRWQAWLDILKLILRAARALRDRHTEAWVLHQLGTRAMCMNYMDEARRYLTDALNLRRAIGDKAGIAVTQHNLGGLPGLPPSIKTGNSNSGSGWRRLITCGAIGVIGMGILILVGLFVFFSPSLFSPPLTSTRAPTRTDRPTDTYTPTDTVTPSFTPSFTPTNTSTLTPSRTPTNTFTPTFTPSFTLTTSMTRTSTNTPDIVRPPVPVVVGPDYDSSFINGGATWYEIQCTSNNEVVVLDWNSVSDPSSISGYYVQLWRYYESINDWVLYQNWNSVGNTQLNVNNETDCGETYTWRVRARDGAGNFSLWSNYRNFILKQVVPGPD
jgi:hypothetical protein